VVRLRGSSCDDHAAGGCGRFDGRWSWLVGNGNSYNITPDVNVGDGLALMALPRWVISTDTRSCRSRLGDSNGHCLDDCSWAARSRSRNWGRNWGRSDCWHHCRFGWWRRRIVSNDWIAGGCSMIFSGQPGRVICCAMLSSNSSRARDPGCPRDPLSRCVSNPYLSGSWLSGCS
jgi:hypothetical protein